MTGQISIPWLEVVGLTTVFSDAPETKYLTQCGDSILSAILRANYSGHESVRCDDGRLRGIAVWYLQCEIFYVPLFLVAPQAQDEKTAHNRDLLFQKVVSAVTRSKPARVCLAVVQHGVLFTTPQLQQEAAEKVGTEHLDGVTVEHRIYETGLLCDQALSKTRQ